MSESVNNVGCKSIYTFLDLALNLYVRKNPLERDIFGGSDSELSSEEEG